MQPDAIVPPYYQDEDVTLYLGDCLDVLAAMEAASVDAVVTDPPYGLEFMGREWDAPWHGGINADAGFVPVGFSDGGRRLPRPTFTGSTNPHCRGCGGRQRGRRDGTAIWKTCMCDRPDFPNVRATEMRAFQEWCEAWAGECLRVLKPGGWLLAFGGTRTWHRLVCGIEDAGFEVRDAVADLTGYDAPGLMWVYGSGFPKSLNVSVAIDKAAGAGREMVGTRRAGLAMNPSLNDDGWYNAGTGEAGKWVAVTAPATEDAARWEGWGTALKPGWEPVAVARKPLAGTVASNVVAYGTGALNIDGCRVGDPENKRAAGTRTYAPGRLAGGMDGSGTLQAAPHDGMGRWPPNVVLGPAAAAGLDRQSGVSSSRPFAWEAHHSQERTVMDAAAGGSVGHQMNAPLEITRGYTDTGGASRYFPVFRYEAKAPASERPRAVDGTAHPTVKPVDLMRWLVRLVTPPGGLVLDPFAGSGTTAEACIVEGFRCVLAEKDPASAELIVARLRKPIQPVLFGDEAS